jgi:glycosyltransferase involved in cell wall biosynthesis
MNAQFTTWGTPGSGRSAERARTAGPKLSLGLPVYNGDNYLEQTLRCLCDQSFEDFELIISDNASTDRTQAICEAFAETDPRIRYHRNATNVGAAPNYNLVFELATGEYFKWVAHDDLYERDFLKKCVEALDQDPGVVLAYTAAVDIDEHGELIREMDFNLHSEAERPSERFRYLTCVNHHCFQVFGIVRSEVLRKTPLIESYVASDRVLIAELALHGRFYEVPERLFLHREHPRRSTAAIADLRERAAWFDTRARTAQELPNLRVYLEYFAAIRRSPLGMLERIRCRLQLLRWWKRNWRLALQDLELAMRGRLLRAFRRAQPVG